MQSIELTPEERSQPYAKYFTRPPAEPTPEHLAAMDTPIDPAKALLPKDRNRLLNPGYEEVEIGWCVLPNGAGYVSNLTRMPGVTLEMFAWWFAWHAIEDLRYKIWWPEGHFAIGIPDPAERTRAQNPTLSLAQRTQGITHHVVEDTGCGPEDILISFMSPAEFGFDTDLFAAQRFIAIAANGKSRPVDTFFLRPWAPAMMCHLAREIDGGIELRTRFWLGYRLVDGKPKCKLPPFVKLPAAVAQGLAIHNVREFTNLASFLPNIHAEHADR